MRKFTEEHISIDKKKITLNLCFFAIFFKTVVVEFVRLSILYYGLKIKMTSISHLQNKLLLLQFGCIRKSRFRILIIDAIYILFCISNHGLICTYLHQIVIRQATIHNACLVKFLLFNSIFQHCSIKKKKLKFLLHRSSYSYQSI